MEEDLHERSTLLAKNSITQRRRRYTENGNSIVDDDEAAENQAEVEQQEELTPRHRSITSSVASDDLAGYEWDVAQWRYYLVEPMVFVLLFAYSLSATIVKNQIIYQTCVVTFGYNVSDCQLLGTSDANNDTKIIEATIQPYVARIFMCISIVESLIPAIFGVFIGAWSDRFGRKPLLVTAFAGFAFYYFIAAVITQLATALVISPWYYLLASLPHALLGGNITYSIATICYISDVSTPQQRPYRLVWYEVSIYVGLVGGSLASGYIYEASSAMGVFLHSAFLITGAFFIIVAVIPESLEHDRPLYVFNNSDAESEASFSSSGNELRRLFDVTLLKEMFWTCFKPRQFNDRSIIWLAILALLTSVFVIDGSMNVFYLFVRQQFHWTIKEYTTYDAVSIFVSTMGNVFGIWLLRRIFKISLVHLALIAVISETASCFMKGFAYSSWQMYAAIALGSLKAMGHPMCRAIITSIVPNTELGKIFSFNTVLQSLLPFIAAPLYTGIYSVTLISFPGFFNIFSANLYLIAIAFLLVILRKRQIFPEHYDLLLN